MSINLSKGQKINLSKENNRLSQVMIGLGWDEIHRNGGFLSLFQTKPEEIDCDAFAILLGHDGKLVNHATQLNECCVYFNNLRHWSGAIVHQGDNLTGAGEGDDEQIFIDLQNVPDEIGAIVFAVNIYDAFKKKQHFGMISNAFIRVVDFERKIELCRFNLSDNYNNKTALIAGGIIRTENGWEFMTEGKPLVAESLIEVVATFAY